MAGFEEQRKRIDPAAIYDVRYEDLVADPVSEIGKMYARLGAWRLQPRARQDRGVRRDAEGI